LIYCRDNNEKKGKRIPVIIIEVLSKSTWKKDMTIKMKKYAELEIEEYWIIDYRNQILAVYKLNEYKYDLYETYYYLTDEELSPIPEVREEELNKAIKEFSPISFPEMTVFLEEVFSFEALDII